jgi:pSer/pThr/pTyr-binding forkhead associated (FHA) protein
MRVRLVAVGDAEQTLQVSLTLPAVLGRGRGATMLVPHPLVSRQHCRLFESEGVVMVEDLESLNGTYVGSDRVREAAIPSGELLTIATFSFRVVYGSGPGGVGGVTANASSWGDETAAGCGESPADPAAASDANDALRVPAPPSAGDEPSGVPIERETDLQVPTLRTRATRPDDSGESPSSTRDRDSAPDVGYSP